MEGFNDGGDTGSIIFNPVINEFNMTSGISNISLSKPIWRREIRIKCFKISFSVDRIIHEQETL
jgi:hypothetical protein